MFRWGLAESPPCAPSNPRQGIQPHLIHLGYLCREAELGVERGKMQIGLEQTLPGDSTLRRVFMNSYELAPYSNLVLIFCPSMS